MAADIKHIDWSPDEKKTMAASGITITEIERQLALFHRGVPPVRLIRACTQGDGIIRIADEEQAALTRAFEEYRNNGRVMKFVPASGAASRMFREWHTAFSNGGFHENDEAVNFATSLHNYPFYQDIEKVTAKDGRLLSQMIDSKLYTEILGYILTAKGLDYGNSPKALLKFHNYPEGARASIDEHLVEAALYVRDANRVARIHFTVSGEHEKMVRDRLLTIMNYYGTRFDAIFDFDISLQDVSTNTIAVDLDGQPFHDEKGNLVFRPSGHGALLANLEGLDADVVFIKNIDNIVADRYKDDTVLWKKILAGYLITIQDEMFHHLLELEKPGFADGKISGIADFCRSKLNISMNDNFQTLTEAEKRHFLFHAMNRPLRVCGMVKNEGEPGGGPFKAETPGGKGAASLQIVEEAQIDSNDPGQRAVWSSSTHFNPVDLVCGLHDYRGRKFNLADFVDQDASIITRKSEKGRDILALERPGLWNGSMAFWNTIFVEVPPSTFAPVKSVKDLLRKAHQQ
jgi:hypothetical protein